MDENQYWQAVINRDAAFDGQFVFAVRSTGIFCRPSCPSRRPERTRVSFFTTPQAAADAGYRACKRCRPTGSPHNPQHAELAVQACRFLEAHQDEKISLANLAAHFSLSPFHFQRVFRREVGLTPHQYVQALRGRLLRSELKSGTTVTQAVLEAGFPNTTGHTPRLGMRPSVYRSGGKNMHILYTFAPCPLGYLLIAATEKGVCAVMLGENPAGLEADLTAEFPAAHLERADTALSAAVSAVLEYLAGTRTTFDLPLDVRATAFQERVWRALRAIPYGQTRTYAQIAAEIGQPTAARAVAHACATNPTALITPCHRVIGADGGLHGYRWGLERKRSLLQTEHGHPVEEMR